MREVYDGRDGIGVVAVAVVVILLLIGLTFYSGTLALGYDISSYAYEHEIEAGPGDNVTSEVAFETGTDTEEITYRYEELSPIAQEFFDTTRAADSATYTPNICMDYVLVCNGYYEEELPTEFTYGGSLDNASLYTIIEYDGDSYLLRTGTSYAPNLFNIAYGYSMVLFRAFLFLHAGVIATATLFQLSGRWKSADDKTYANLVGGGVVAATVGFLMPYVQLSGLVSNWDSMTLLAMTIVFGYGVFAVVLLLVAIARRFDLDLSGSDQFDYP